MSPVWELVEEREGMTGGSTRRLRVPNGYIYRIIEWFGEDKPLIGIVFVPDRS